MSWIVDACEQNLEMEVVMVTVQEMKVQEREMQVEIYEVKDVQMKVHEVGQVQLANEVTEYPNHHPLPPALAGLLP